MGVAGVLTGVRGLDQGLGFEITDSFAHQLRQYAHAATREARAHEYTEERALSVVRGPLGHFCGGSQAFKDARKDALKELQKLKLHYAP